MNINIASSSSNCPTKTYAPSPSSSHTKHKILQKHMPFANLDS